MPFIFPFANGTNKIKFRCRCFSMAFGFRPELESGGKIILPSSALHVLTAVGVQYPMLFSLTNTAKGRTTHAGVIEFTAGPGICYMPLWMMQNLLLQTGDTLWIKCVSLPVATYSKFKAESSEFMEITNPKAVLENTLRNFACLTTGDVIAIYYNHNIYKLRVLKTQPANAINVIECDMKVEFEAPVIYEPQAKKIKLEKQAVLSVAENPYGTSGFRVDGKALREHQKYAPIMKVLPPGQPDNDFQYGELLFDRSIIPISDRPPKLPEDPFKGEGYALVDYMNLDEVE